MQYVTIRSDKKHVYGACNEDTLVTQSLITACNRVITHMSDTDTDMDLGHTEYRLINYTKRVSSSTLGV